MTPLAESELPPAVVRIVSDKAPLAMRQMAARGLAALPPQDLVVALYQLAHGGDATLMGTAAESAAKLPEPLLKVALPAAHDPRVLHFLGQRLSTRRDAVELLLRNRALHETTVEHLAAVCGPDELDIIAQDEQRLLRAPSIIAALYLNPRARASTALKAVELAARNGVVVDIPGFEDVVASLHGVTLTAEDDASFQAVVPDPLTQPAKAEEADPDKPNMTQEEIEKAQAEEEAGAFVGGGTESEKKKRFEDLPIPLQIRAATLGNAFDRAVAVRSPVRTVSMAAIRSPGLRVNEVVKYAANRALHEDVIRYISNKKDWVQMGSVRLALINNNKTPLGAAMRFLAFINGRDLKVLAKSKNIPGPLQKAAKELLQKRDHR
jgi:hypothetical protein